MNPRYYHNEVLETIAQKVISKYDPSLLDTPAPIPVDDIIEQLYGLTLEFQFIRNNGRILGLTIFEDTMVPIFECRGGRGYELVPVKAGTVIIDASLLECRSNGRYRFTCAHELAHWILHRELFIRFGISAAMTGIARSAETASIEWQANRLGGCLLMPKCTVKKAFYRICDQIGNVTAVLAEMFDVSQQAMRIRLTELGLLQ